MNDLTNIIGTIITLYISIGIIYLVVKTFQGEKINPGLAILGWPKALYDWYQKQ